MESFTESSSSSWLDQRLNLVRRQLILGFLLFVVASTVIVEFAAYLQKSSSADQIANSVRHSLISQDVRGALMILNASSLQSFSSVKVDDHIGRNSYVVSSSVPAPRFSYSFRKNVYFDSTNSSIAAEMIFYYPFLLGQWLIFSLSLLYAVLALFFYRRTSVSLAFHWMATVKIAAAEAKEHLATQVAHDIRSPLATLEVVLKDADQLPDDQRTLVRNASNRIREIANDLLKLNREKSPNRQREPAAIPLAPLVSEIFEEKRSQYRGSTSLKFVLQLETPLAFSKISESELKRALSNLINNSIEASEKGQITLLLKQEGRWTHLGVSDEGKGIPPELIAKLGAKGVSFGKGGNESGSGLGLYHAKSLAEKAGGELQIKSEVGKGTTITMLLPSAAPDWLPSAIQATGTKLVVVDDDPAISDLWRKRLSDCSLDASGLISFRDTSSFKAWLEQQSDWRSNTYLIDQDIEGSPIRGLDLITEKKIASNSILATNLASYPALQAECRSVGVRLLPKELISFVPIASTSVLKVLLDDDSSIQTLWKITAKRRGIELEVFSKSANLLQRAPHLDRRTEIFLDENLGDGEPSGSDVAEQLGKLGFKAIFLCTGFNPGTVSPSKWIRKVIGKEPPWV